LLFFPSLPFAASFLSPREKAIAQARLNRDHRPQSHGGMTGWSGFKAVVSDPNSWLFMLIYASCKVFYKLCLPVKSSSKQALLSAIVGVATISYFLPAVCHSIFMLSLKIMLLTQLPVDQTPRVLLDQCPRDDCSSKPRRMVYGGLPSFT